ncbi:MAG: aminotransferase class V-fold PLP-dependent enzyme [Phototrophicaceae bacterium]
MLNIEQLRAETQGLAHVTHFNNAGAGLMPQPVVDAMIEHLQLEAQIGGYEAVAKAQDKISRTYDAVAELLNAHRDEIAIVENATRAWTMAFYGIQFKDGERILTSVAEYASNYIAFLQVQKQVNISIEVVPNDEHGQLDLVALEQMMDDKVRLIAISHVPSQGGLIQPAKEVGAIAKKYGALYLLDACQSVGQMVIDVQEIGCHMLSATGRKYLRGARGIGFLYVARDVIPQLEPSVLDLHSATWLSADSYELAPTAKRFENWEMNISAKIGLGVAVDYALAIGLDNIEARTQSLATTFREMLNAIAGITTRDMGQKQCGIVTFSIEGHDAREISQKLREHHINTSVSPYTYAVLDFKERDLDYLVRASVHYYNTQAELERFCDVLTQILSENS